MTKKEKTGPGYRPGRPETGCCKVESMVTVDERGQMVLPKELRDKAQIRAGDKLALITWQKEGQVCCISLVKSEDFEDMVRGTLGPMMKEIIG
jgi:AbrB family looped-hinge helix DNA binding protein